MTNATCICVLDRSWLCLDRIQYIHIQIKLHTGMWKSLHLACIQWNRMSLGMVLPASYPFHPMHTRFRHNGVHRGNKLNSARSRVEPQGPFPPRWGWMWGRANGTRRTETIRQRLHAWYEQYRVTKAGHIGAASLLGCYDCTNSESKVAGSCLRSGHYVR